MTECPCCSGKLYEECCAPCHQGTPAPTAEALMRSRYSAYVVADIDYLARTLDPKKRYKFDEAGVKRWAENTKWLGLEIRETRDGGENDNQGEVEFIAKYRFEEEDKVEQHHELARFRKEGDQWYFVQGQRHSNPPVVRDSPKVGRNDPCPCDSGKKFKKCCG